MTTGLESIIQEIKADAEAKARDIIANAEKEAEAIKSDAKKQADLIISDSKTQAEQKSKLIAERGNSAKELSYRKALLCAKQEIISEMLTKALEKLKSLPDSEYFALLVKLIAKHQTGQSGKLMLSEKDYKRTPAGFAGEVAKASDNKLTLDDGFAKISSGFVLVYGGIEENCSFEALIASNDEMLKDIVKSKLFD